MIVIDTETTGFSPREDRIIEIAVLNYDDGEVLLHTHLNPGRPIPEKITEITGITDAMVIDAPIFSSIADQLMNLIATADAICGYNPWFDRGMISGEFARLNGEQPMLFKWPVMICAKRTWDIHEPREQRHLQNAYKRFVNPIGFEGAHGALADTRATREVLLSQINTFSLAGKTWEEFDPDQKRWIGPTDHLVAVDGVVMVNFGKYKGVNCHDIDVGYWRWVVKQDFPEHVKTVADFITVVKGGKATKEEIYSFVYGRYM